MKKLYCSPELEIISFLPVKNLATWNEGDNGFGSELSTGEGKNDYDSPVTPEEDL